MNAYTLTRFNHSLFTQANAFIQSFSLRFVLIYNEYMKLLNGVLRVPFYTYSSYISVEVTEWFSEILQTFI